MSLVDHRFFGKCDYSTAGTAWSVCLDEFEKNKLQIAIRWTQICSNTFRAQAFEEIPNTLIWRNKMCVLYKEELKLTGN